MLVLEEAKSSYLGPFQTLCNRIQRGSREAVDNLKFLEKLTKPCEALSQAEPREILGIVPGLLQWIRLVWTISQYYNTEERLTGLLRKVSNEIINRCCAKIELRDVFDNGGDVEGSICALEESIKCGVFWKEEFLKTKVRAVP
jgi:dynein heavy chain